jgi:hypothetical protein
MTLVTRGLGKKLTTGAVATLVSFGIGITVLEQPPEQPTIPSVVNESARFLQEGYFIVRPDTASQHTTYQFTVVEIGLYVDSTFKTISSFEKEQVVEPVEYNLEFSVDIPSIEIDQKFKWYSYIDYNIIEDDELLLLGLPTQNKVHDSINGYIIHSNIVDNSLRVAAENEFKQTLESILTNLENIRDSRKVWKNEIALRKQQDKEDEDLILGDM